MPISFTKTSWVDFTTKVTATQMNRIEKGIDDSVIQLNNIDSGTYKVPKATDSDKLGNKLPSEYAPAVHNHALNLGEEIIALFNGDVNTLNGVCDATFTGLDASNIPTREHYHVINLGSGDVADRGAQLAIDTYGVNMFYRSMRSGYTTWKRIIHEGNIKTYSPKYTFIGGLNFYSYSTNVGTNLNLNSYDSFIIKVNTSVGVASTLTIPTVLINTTGESYFFAYDNYSGVTLKLKRNSTTNELLIDSASVVNQGTSASVSISVTIYAK